MENGAELFSALCSKLKTKNSKLFFGRAHEDENMLSISGRADFSCSPTWLIVFSVRENSFMMASSSSVQSPSSSGRTLNVWVIASASATAATTLRDGICQGRTVMVLDGCKKLSGHAERFYQPRACHRVGAAELVPLLFEQGCRWSGSLRI